MFTEMRLIQLFYNTIKYILIALVYCYKLFISPFLSSNCRFEPTCSSYAIQALRQYNLIKAFILILKRLKKCHPWGKFGMDTLPIKGNKTCH